MVADVPAAKAGWVFNQLFVNGQRATRARTPNEGYLRTEAQLPGFENPSEHRGEPEAAKGFVYRAGELPADAAERGGWIVLYHSWTNSLHPIESVDPATRQCASPTAAAGPSATGSATTSATTSRTCARPWTVW